MAPSEDNTHRYRQLVEAFNRHDSDAGADRYHKHATVTDHGMGQSMSGRAEIRAQYWQGWFDASSDQRLDNVDVFGAGEWTVARGMIRGTHDGRWAGIAPTGRRFGVDVCDLVRWREGRIVEEHLYYDRGALGAQRRRRRKPGGMSADRNARTMRRFYDLFSRGDVDALDGLLADDFVSNAIPAELGIGRDRTAAGQFAQMHAAAFGDLQVEALDLVAAHDRVAGRGQMTCIHEGAFLGIPASRRTVEHEFADAARFNDHGELVEIWNYADSLALAQQLQPRPVSAP